MAGAADAAGAADGPASCARPGTRESWVTATANRMTSEAAGAGARVTESFSYTAKGVMGFVYDRVLFRPTAMTKGMQRTLERVKTALEQ